MIRKEQPINVLAIYIEPAPYILDFIRVLRREYPRLTMRVLFIGGNVTQAWNARLVEEGLVLLDINRVRAAGQIFREILLGKMEWLHLAGWGHSLLLLALLAGRLRGCRISVESDTHGQQFEAKFKTAVKDALYPLVFRAANLFFPGGRPQAHYLRRFRVPEHRIRVAQMTVDVSEIQAALRGRASGAASFRYKLAVPAEATVVIFVGRLESFKGVDTLLQAFSLLRFEEDLYLFIVGDGSLRCRVERAKEENKQIRYLGWQDTAGVRAAMGSADVAVVPSSFEPWGLVVNEAMASGLPVIATQNVGAVEDLVGDGKNGFVVPSDDPVALSVAIKALADDPQNLKRMAAESQRRISGWRLEDEARIVWGAWNEQLNAKVGLDRPAS